MVWTSFAAVGPEIKLFLVGASIAGPVTIATLIFILKRIEKEKPDRIRWR